MNTTPCESCGAALTPAVRFCPRCGRGATRDGVTPQPLAPTRPARRVGPNAVQCGTCGTQTIADAAFCFECGAPIGTLPVDDGGPVRMQAASSEPAPRPKMPLWAKLLIAVGVLALGGFGACVACVGYLFHSAPGFELKAAEQKRARVPPGLAAQMPSDEAAFCAAVDRAAEAATAAGGASASSAVLSKATEDRRAALKEYAAHPAVTNWLGVMVQRMPRDESVSLELQLPCAARLTNGKLVVAVGAKGSGQDPSSIRAGTPLYDKVMQLATSRPVVFTAVLNVDESGDLAITGFSQAAKVIAPNFVIDLQRVENVAGPASSEPDAVVEPQGAKTSAGGADGGAAR